MHGGVILFRGAGTAARRYLESDRSTADEYYLEGGVALAEFSVVDGSGALLGAGALTPEQYAAWVDWINPLTAESMGTPRLAGDGRLGSPRFAEMVINAPKSLSIAAALHPGVSDALDAAQQDAMAEIRSWLGLHSVTRIGPRGEQQVVGIEQLETVSVAHRTSRAGDPHRHIHFQISTRAWARGAWRGLDTSALFRQQGAIRALGTAVIAAHPQLAAVLDQHGLTLDPVTGEVMELQQFNAVMSKRGDQVRRNLTRFEAEWSAAHPGATPGPVTMSRLVAMAWDHKRPNKKPGRLGSEADWRRELDAAGYTRNLPRGPRRGPVLPADLRVQEIANRALDRCAASASTWTRHTVQEQVTRIVTEAGVRARPTDLRELIGLTTNLAVENCLSVLPGDAPRPDHIAHLTSLHVVAVETALRDQLTHLAAASPGHGDVRRSLSEAGIDVEQERTAAAVASDLPLVVVEAPAGAGKTTMLGVAFRAMTAEGRAVRVLAPTKKAADVAAIELGVPADSVAKLVHANGWRWNDDGAWTRLAPGTLDPAAGRVYDGPSPEATLVRGERVVVDEAGMLDQDTAHALLTLTAEAGATVALVGDRAQLPAVGRGGVLDIAAQLVDSTYELGAVHRFTDPHYADLTLQLRTAADPTQVFDRLHALGLVTLHPTIDDAHTAIAQITIAQTAITTATNDEARALNARIREERVARGEVDNQRTTAGSDGLPIGKGDVIQTRRNDRDLHVANRQTWTVHHVGQDSTVWAVTRGDGRKRAQSVALPREYVTEHTHLAYASTAYGVQGATVNESHTVLTDALAASGTYVGMTRGRDRNLLHVIAADLDDAREQFSRALTRDRADRGLLEATRTAEHEVKNLAPDDSLAIVEAECARLTAAIERAEHEAAALLRRQESQRERARARQREWAVQTQRVTHADATLAQTRTVIAGPLMASASADGSAYLNALSAMWDATAAAHRAGRFSRRTADRIALAAAAAHRVTEQTLLQRWGSTPASTTNIPHWIDAVVRKQTDLDPRVVAAQEAARQAHQALHSMLKQPTADEAPSEERAFATRAMRTAASRALHAQLLAQVEQGRRDLAAISAMPVTDAADHLRRNPVSGRPAGQAASAHLTGPDNSALDRLGSHPPAQHQPDQSRAHLRG